jgi:hypothetical protein
VFSFSWLVAVPIGREQKHYLIQKEQETIKVYRDYKLPLLRMACLSANILICLFEGIVQTVDLHLKPDTLDCGVDKPKGDHEGLHKELKGGSRSIRFLGGRKLSGQLTLARWLKRLQKSTT